MTTRSGPASAPADVINRAPAAAAICSGVQPLTARGPPSSGQCGAPKRLPGHPGVVEGQLAPVLELLALLMALARDHHDIPAPGHPDGVRDGLAAICRVLNLAPAAREDLLDDRLGILRARVVRGDDHLVGESAGDPAHDRALAAVTVAAAAVYDPLGPLRDGACDP